MSEHAPFTVGKTGWYNTQCIVPILDSTGKKVAEVNEHGYRPIPDEPHHVTYNNDVMEARARFIVRACNSHEQLLEALRNARGWFTLDGAGAKVRAKIDAAIAAAEGADHA